MPKLIGSSVIANHFDAQGTLLRQRFQQFVLLAIALSAIVEALAWFYVPTDVLHAELLSTDGFAAVVDGGLPLYVLLVAARLLILFGLLTFHPAARTLFLFLAIVSVGMSVFWGFRVTAPIEAPFLLLTNIIDGVILALAYYSPASRAFRKDLPED